MAKDPAFLFYPGDWNLGTMHLTLLEKGCYIELLILQFAKGKFTQAQAKHMLNGSFDLVWASLSDKFRTDGDFYWNDRLRIEKEKREKFSESRRNNGSIRKNEKKEEKHMPKHMENENENTNTLLKQTEKKSFNTNPLSSDFNGLPEHYIDKSIELVRYAGQALIDKTTVIGMWDIFKVQKLTGEEHYQNEGKVYSHFLDWLKKQKFTNGTIKQPIGVTKHNESALELLRKGKERFANITGQQGNNT